MTPELRERCLDFARSEIARKVAAMRLRAGAGMIQQGAMLGLAPGRPLIAQQGEPDTWELVLFVRIRWWDTVTGDGETDLVPLRVPRVTGTLATDSVWEFRADLIDAPSVPRERHIEIEFYTRRWPRPPVGTPIWDEGMVYPGSVQLTMRETVRDTAVPTGVDHVIVIPPEGVTVPFTASHPDEILTLRPVGDSIVKVREET